MIHDRAGLCQIKFLKFQHKTKNDEDEIKGAFLKKLRIAWKELNQARKISALISAVAKLLWWRGKRPVAQQQVEIAKRWNN